MTVDCQKYLIGSLIKQSLDLASVVDAARASQRLVTKDENRTPEGFQLLLKPFELLLADVFGITTLMALRLLVSRERLVSVH